ncbi:hypothetical protein, partial [Burkholderia vietnamiensis]
CQNDNESGQQNGRDAVIRGTPVRQPHLARKTYFSCDPKKLLVTKYVKTNGTRPNVHTDFSRKNGTRVTISRFADKEVPRSKALVT